MSFQQLLTAEVFSFLFVFCRVGSCFMLLPAFGSAFVTPWARLGLAAAVSLILTPMIEAIPAIPSEPIILLSYIVSEVAIGLMIGSIAKIIASSLHVAGTIMAMQASLAQASLFDPNQASQSTVFGTFLDMMALVLIFTLNIHHVIIMAVLDSYSVFAPASPIPVADFSELITKTVSKAFKIGFQLSIPLIIIGVLINLASGLLARLMPSFQVFFVIMPVQILVAIFIFMTTFSAGLMWYMGVFSDSMSNLFK